MSNTDNKLMLEILKAVQETLSRLEEGQQRTNRRLGSIESHMAAFHSTVASHEGDMASLLARIERIEKRLNLAD